MAQSKPAAVAILLLLSAQAAESVEVVAYKGYEYRTRDGASPTDTNQAQCEDAYAALPSGFDIAPDDANSRAVTSAYAWGTYCTVLSNGWAYWTTSGNLASETPGSLCYDSTDRLGQIGSTYAVTECYRRILVRRACVAAMAGQPTSMTVYAQQEAALCQRPGVLDLTPTCQHCAYDAYRYLPGQNIQTACWGGTCSDGSTMYGCSGCSSIVPYAEFFCGAGFYHSIGTTWCAACPANSDSSGATTSCTCNEGYYKGRNVRRTVCCRTRWHIVCIRCALAVMAREQTVLPDSLAVMAREQRVWCANGGLWWQAHTRRLGRRTARRALQARPRALLPRCPPRCLSLLPYCMLGVT